MDHVKTIKEVFETGAPDFVVDAKLVSRIHTFERDFANRDENHIAFFGNNLTGVHPMRFRPSDRDAWLMDVLDLDELLIEDGIRRLPHNQTWVRANDVFNLSCVWLLHRIMNAKSLSPSLRDQAAVDIMLILSYKFLGSLLAHNYPYPADEGTALATVQAMSRKFSIKTAGSWGALLRMRAEEIVSSRSIHRRTYLNMDSDKGVIDMVSDIQNRLKEVIKSINKIFYDLHARGVKVHNQSSLREIDGSVVLRDKTRQFTPYIRYIHDVMDDPGSFVRDELVDIIGDAQHTMNKRLLTEVLTWMSKNRNAKGCEYITELADETLIYAFETITNNRATYNNNGGLMPLLTKLRSMYMASRMADESLLRTKELAEKVVANSIQSKNASVVASVRTGVQLYIVLRAMAMSYYQGGSKVA